MPTHLELPSAIPEIQFMDECKNYNVWKNCDIEQ